MSPQEWVGLVGAIVLAIIIVTAFRVRNRIVAEQKVQGDPVVKAQLEVVAARARKRRSDFGTKRPRKVNAEAMQDSGNPHYPPG